MKITQLSLVFCLTLLFHLNGNAQLQKVIVEKYYISDANDATDTLGGGINIGSTTYRIYVDLAPGSLLKKIYGDANHPFPFKVRRHFSTTKVMVKPLRKTM